MSLYYVLDKDGNWSQHPMTILDIRITHGVGTYTVAKINADGTASTPETITIRQKAVAAPARNAEPADDTSSAATQQSMPWSEQTEKLIRCACKCIIIWFLASFYAAGVAIMFMSCAGLDHRTAINLRWTSTVILLFAVVANIFVFRERKKR